MSQQRLSNPVDRLYEVLLPFFSTERALSIYPSVEEVIADMVGVPKRSHNAIYALGAFYKLIDDAILFVKKMDVDQELHLAPLQAIRDAFQTVNLGTSFDVVRKQLAPQAVAFRFVVAAARKEPSELAIDREKIDNLRKQGKKLQESILQSDLPVDLKSALYECMQRFEFSLVSYKLYGIEVIDDAVKMAIGTLVVNSERVSESKQSDVFKASWAYIQNASTLVSFAKNSKDLLAGAVSKVLELAR